MMHRPALAVALLAALACLSTAPLRAVTVVVPRDAHAVEGDSLTNLGPEGTVQLRYSKISLLTALLIAGDTFTGISVRLNSTAPAFEEMLFTRFDIRIGEAEIGELGTTLASNFIRTPTTVRTGPLTLPADAFSHGGSPNSFGAVIRFDTPFSYSGGELLIEIRTSLANTGYAIDAVTDSRLDMVHSSDPDATTGVPSPGNGWVIGFETTPRGLTRTERIAIPSGAAAAEGNFDHAFGGALGQRAQMRYLPTHLGSLKPGDTIQGIGFRLEGTSPPFRSTTFSNFVFSLGTPSAGYSVEAGTSFDSNRSSVTFLRNGPLTLHLEGFGTGPNPFPANASFQGFYLYTGGPLVVDVLSSHSTTPLFIDSFVGGGYGGGLYADDQSATVGTTPAPDTNWAMELHVARDGDKPEVAFTGSTRLNAAGRGTAHIRVTDASTVGTVTIKAGSAKARRLRLTKAKQDYEVPVRSRAPRTPRPVTVTVTAVDASGNRTVAKQVYEP